MALAADTIRVVARLLRDRPISGDAVTFGVQKIGGDHATLSRILAREGYPARSLSAAEIVPDPLGRPNRVHQDTLFRMLGFHAVHSIDVSPGDKPTHQLDLNEPVPPELWARYGLVCDGGTTEHCFNAPQVLANAVRLLRPGGHVVHVTPITGWLQHGFYQFTPGLFFHFYAENGFADLEARILYEGRCMDPREYLPRRDFLGRKALLVFVGRKTASGGEVRWPIQLRYATPEIERVVRGFGEPSGSGARSGRRVVLQPAALLRDIGEMVRQYVRLSWRARSLGPP